MYLSKAKVSYMLIIESTQDHCPRKHPLLAGQFLSAEEAAVVFLVAADELLLVLQVGLMFGALQVRMVLLYRVQGDVADVARVAALQASQLPQVQGLPQLLQEVGPGRVLLVLFAIVVLLCHHGVVEPGCAELAVSVRVSPLMR